MSWEKIEDYLFDKYCVEGEDRELATLMEEHDKEVRKHAIDEFSKKIISQLQEVAIKELGITKEQFAMDKGEYSSYCSLSLYDVKEQVNQVEEELTQEEEYELEDR